MACRRLAGPQGWQTALAIGALLALGACTTNRGPAPDVPDDRWIRRIGPVTSRVVKIQSDVGGQLGLAAVVAYPDSAITARFREGAPVCVVVPDGFGAGNVPAGYEGFAADGIVTIALALPAGDAGGQRSGGQFDYRGFDCAMAVRDVIRFAHGETRGQMAGVDTLSTIAGMIPYPVLTDEITVLGLGNGGNLAAVTFALYADLLAGLANYVAWEVPGGDQFVTLDLGGAAAEAESLTSHYVPGSCSEATCQVDYSRLSIDLTRLDLVRDPRTGIQVPISGTVFFDDNGNGSIGGKELALHPLIGPITTASARAYYSLETARALQLREIRLAIVADTLATADYWALRDPTVGDPNYYEGAATAIDSLRVMVLGSADDHTQGTPDHPHIVRETEAWKTAGSRWVRLNPDASYLAEVGAAGGVESRANETVGFGDVVPRLLPEETDADEPLAKRAAVMEMADRYHYDRWESDLNSVLVITNP